MTTSRIPFDSRLVSLHFPVCIDPVSSDSNRSAYLGPTHTFLGEALNQIFGQWRRNVIDL
jgi:hypothetical protein